MDSLVLGTRNWHLPLNYIVNRTHVVLLTTISISLTKPIRHFRSFGPIYLIGSSFSGTRHNPTADCQVNCIYNQVGFPDTHLGMPPGRYQRHNVRSKFWWFRGLTIRTVYHILLRSLSWWETRHPFLKFVIVCPYKPGVWLQTTPVPSVVPQTILMLQVNWFMCVM